MRASHFDLVSSMPRRSSVIYRSQRPAPRVRRVGVVTLLAIVAAGCAAGAQRSANQKWVQLFNGKNLDGSVPKFSALDLGVNYNDTFRVENGVLKVSYDKWTDFGNPPHFGHLFYKNKKFSHYIVAAEYRFVGTLYPGAPSYTLRNSGIMIHSQDPRTMPRDQNFPISIEDQLLGGLSDGKPRPTGNMCSPGTMVDFAGKPDTRHCINSTSKTYDGDQWVLSETLVLGDSIVKHIIDHDTVLVYTHPRQAAGVVTGFDPAQLTEGKLLSSGFVALQAEGHPVDFRNVRLLNLEGCMDPKAANSRSRSRAPCPASPPSSRSSRPTSGRRPASRSPCSPARRWRCIPPASTSPPTARCSSASIPTSHCRR